MTKKRSKLRVYCNRLVILAILSTAAYGAYKGYHYIQPATIPTATTNAQGKELEAIMNSEAFKAKAQNLAEQQLISAKIEKKKAQIADLNKEIGTLQSDLETKRNASLSL